MVLLYSLSRVQTKWGAQKQTGDNPKVVLAEFSTLSCAVFVKNAISWHVQAWPCIKLKTQPKQLLDCVPFAFALPSIPEPETRDITRPCIAILAGQKIFFPFSKVKKTTQNGVYS
jgi:hypothetical protein